MAENDPIVLDPPTFTVFGDGDYTGAGGYDGGHTSPGHIRGYGSSQHFWNIEPITPSVAPLLLINSFPNKRLVYINGIQTTNAAHAYTLKLLSVVSGASVIGIYNQSGDGAEADNVFEAVGSFLGDLAQSLGDKMGVNRNPATATLANAVYEACVERRYLNIAAHSQGAIITSRGTRQAIKRLLRYFGRSDQRVRPLLEQVEQSRGVGRLLRGPTRTNNDLIILEQALRTYILPVVEQRLNEFVSIQTFGGAAVFYPNGPVYRHVYNRWDPVAVLFGQGDLITGPGRGARVERLDRNSGSRGRDFVADHSVTNVYLQSGEHYVDRNGNTIDRNYIPIDMSIVRAG